MKMFRLVILVLMFISTKLYGELRGGRATTADIPLKGNAIGGTLIVGNVMGRNSNFACVETLPSETGQSVVYKLAKAIAYSDAIFEYSHYFSIVKGQRVSFDREKALANMADGDTLRISGFPGDYFLAGSEKGFGIPQPSLSLSCTYDKTKDEIVLNWINPFDNYDHILVRMFWTKFDHGWNKRIAGNSTSLKISRQEIPVDVNDLDVRVFGFRNNIPSNLSVIHLSGNCQDELFGVPFTNGIAPNWAAWSTGENVETDAFKQGDKYTNMKTYNPALSLSTKPFYQIIKGSKTGNTHGIYRKFLGLMPGHTYRIIAGLTTLDMNATENDWIVSLCAAYNRGADNLTAKQLAGLSALPNGKKGGKAGEIVSFGKGKGNTQGKFSIVCSDVDSYITLPQDVNTITLWIRFNCKNPDGKIGFSGVKLEDVTENKDIKTLEQIRQEESLQEVKLLNWEKAARAKTNEKPAEPNQ